MSELHLTAESFKKTIIEEKKTALVDFWAPWCMPCRMLAPVIDEIASAYVGRVTVGKVNVDEQGDLAQQFGVASIPTLILFKDGQAVGRTVGVQSKAAITQALDQLVGK